MLSIQHQMLASLRPIAICAFLVTASASAQVNDNCSGAIDIDLYAPADCPSNNFTINFNNSTISTNPPACDVAGSQIRDLWYRFYSANNTSVFIYLESSQSSHIGFGVYTACGVYYACLSGAEGYVEIPVNQNTHYYLQMYTLVNFDPSNSGFFCLHWENAPPAPPVNDECANAILLNVGSTCNYTSGNSAWATPSNTSLFCNPNIISSPNDDVWYRFVAPAATTVITVHGDGTAPTGYDAVLMLGNSSSCTGSVAAIECDNAGGPGGVETITTDVLLPGATYYVRVYDLDGASPQPGTFGICVYAPDFTGMDDATTLGTALLTPNGMLGAYAVRTPYREAATCELLVLDPMGRTVFSDAPRLVPEVPHLLDLTTFAPGTYLVVLRHNGDMLAQRFIHF